MISNPTIEELHNDEEFRLLKKLEHGQVKEFVLSEVKKGGRLIRFYQGYQTLMIITGILFIVISVVKALKGEAGSFKYSAAALIFGFTVMIILHELIHGAAFKLTGVPKVTYGAYLKEFMFYAEADRYVLNRKQFTVVALAPLITVKIVTLTGIILFLSHPAVYFFIVLMSLHSLFCAGDITLLSYFYSYGEEIFTYDNRAERKSYYYLKKQLNQK